MWLLLTAHYVGHRGYRTLAAIGHPHRSISDFHFAKIKIPGDELNDVDSGFS